MPVFVGLLTRQFLNDPIEFPKANEDFLPPQRYLSMDNIENTLARRGSGVVEGKFRIYSYFLKNKDNAKRAAFVREEHGTGGSINDRGYVSSDSKGLALSRGVMDKSTHILLSWSTVAKYVDKLIRENRYLSEKEIAYLDAYEKKQVASAVRGFYSNREDDVLRPFEQGTQWDYESEIKQIVPQFENPERVQEIFAMMQQTFESEMPNGRNYDYHKRCLETVKEFAEGKYNLFPGSPYRRKTPVKAAEVEDKQEPTKAEKPPVIEDFEITEYNLPLGTTVYIGKDEMEILSISAEKVELFDGTLIPLDLPTDVFLQRLRDNPLNDHLKKLAAEKGIEIDNDLKLFVQDELKEIEWLDGKTEDFTDDEIADIVNDLKPEFEGRFFDRSEDGEDFGGWYDDFCLDVLLPYLESISPNREIEKQEEPQKNFSGNPILSRYQEAKKAYPQHLAMVRVGDFYEFFGDDAIKVAKVLDIAMTSRPINETERIPMCGVPYHIVDKYLEKILDADLLVAIFEDGSITTKEVQEVEVIRTSSGNYLLLGEDAELAAPILKKEYKTRTLLDGRRLLVCELEPYLTHQHYADLREHNIKIMEFSLQDVRGRGEMPILLDPSVVSKNECDAVYAFLNATHLYDVEVEFDFDTSEVVAKDEENEWRGKDLFEFLLNEVVALDENYMLIEGMGNNQPEVDALIKYAEQYGAKIRTVKRNAPEFEEADDFEDINPAEIRKNLAKNGIVDGVVVDEEALNNSDFIRQVMRDVGEEDLEDK